MFTITITKSEIKIKEESEWKVGADPDNGRDGYGYAPKIKKEVFIEETILIQKVKELNLISVIKAINKYT